jgi:hypothetical protein
MKINKKYHCSNFSLSEAEIQGLLHPAEANLGHILARFLSLHLPSTQPESPLTYTYMCLLKYVLKCEQKFSFFIFRPGLASVNYTLALTCV